MNKPYDTENHVQSLILSALLKHIVVAMMNLWFVIIGLKLIEQFTPGFLKIYILSIVFIVMYIQIKYIYIPLVKRIGLSISSIIVFKTNTLSNTPWPQFINAKNIWSFLQIGLFTQSTIKQTVMHLTFIQMSLVTLCITLALIVVYRLYVHERVAFLLNMHQSLDYYAPKITTIAYENNQMNDCDCYYVQFNSILLQLIVPSLSFVKKRSHSEQV